MKVNTFLKNVCVFSSVAYTSFAMAQSPLSIPQSTNIVIDGKLEDWANIPFTNDFVKHDDGTTSSLKTKAKVTWDAQNLYIAFDVADKNIVGQTRVRDNGFFNTDDLVEVFIDPDGDGKNYLEIGVNASGSIYDYVIICNNATCGGWQDNAAFNIENIQTATTINGTLNNSTDTDTGYLVEMKIPFSSLNTITNSGFSTPVDKSTWKVNLFRIDYSETKALEYQSWNPHNSFGFHQPSKFGTFEFSSVITNLEKKNNNQIWTIQHKQLVLKEDISIQIFNTQGQVIPIKKVALSYDLSTLKSGIYFIHGGGFVEKILIP